MERTSTDSRRYCEELGQRSPHTQGGWDDRDGRRRTLSDSRSSPPSQWHRGYYRHDIEDGPPDSVHLDDSRSLSSHHYPSDSGYHSSGALSDGKGSGNFDHGYHTMSSMRSVGSVGSQGSTEREHRPAIYNPPHRQFSFGGPPGRVMIAASHIMNGETRFPTAMYSYAASEAAKSDIATVCSGSVVEDIDVASVLSADLNVPQTPTNTERIVVVGSSSLRRSNSGGVGGTPRSVEFAQHPATSIPAVACMPPRQQQNPPLGSARASSPLQPTIAIPLNDMGPPLSRSLLLQQQQPPGGGAGGGSSSRAGSVRSFGSHRSMGSSDVVAHVDTDDCGGSLAESGDEDHSDHGDEKEGGQDRTGDESLSPNAAATVAAGDGETAGMANPLLQNGMTSSHANGRTSPGGTVYKGRGVRRYQGRYMHLPLKRFHQNGVSMMAGNEMMEDGTTGEQRHTNGFHFHSRHDRPSSPRWGGDGHAAAPARRSRSRSRSPPPPQDRRGGGRYKRTWSCSRSRSPPRTRKNGHHRRSRGRGNGWNERGDYNSLGGRGHVSNRYTRFGGGNRNLRSSSGRSYRSTSRSESPSGGGIHRYNNRKNIGKRR